MTKILDLIAPWLKYVQLIGFGLLLAFAGWQWHKAKNLTLERDQAVTARGIAEHTLEAVRRESILNSEALEQARRDDNDRQNFITENNGDIIRGSAAGNGPVAPVLRDTLERVRRRYDARAGSQPNP